MSNKTELYQVKFLLVNKDQAIPVKGKTLVGRSEGDIILSDAKMSSRHCELIPKGLNLFVKDLNSTNGVYVNKQQIPPNKEFCLSFGDIIKFGDEEFILQGNEIKNSSAQPGIVERRSRKEHTTISAKVASLISFFSVPKEWKGIYLLLILLTAASMIMNIHLDAPLPLELTFLSKLYSQLIIPYGIRNILMVWILCLANAYILSVYVKSNLGRFLSLIPLILIVVNIVNFVDGPVWYVKNYVEDRHEMLELKKSVTPIVDLKRMVAFEIDFQRAYVKINSILLNEEKDAVDKDYNNVVKIIDKKIEALKPQPGR